MSFYKSLGLEAERPLYEVWLFYLAHLVPALFWVVRGDIVLPVDADMAFISMLRLGFFETLSLSPFMSLLLVGFYKITAAVPWYSLMLFLTWVWLVFLSYTLMRFLLERLNAKGWLRNGLVCSYASASFSLLFYVLQTLNYSTVTVLIFGMGLAVNLTCRFRLWWILIPSFLLRYDLLLFLPAIFAPFGLMALWEGRSDLPTLRGIGLLLVATLILVFGGKLFYSDAYKDWLQYNHARSYFLHFDFPAKVGSPVDTEFSESQILSLNNNWWHYDEEFLPTEKMVASALPYYPETLRLLNPFYRVDDRFGLLRRLISDVPLSIYLHMWALASLFLLGFGMRRGWSGALWFVTGSSTFYLMLCLLQVRESWPVTSAMLVSLLLCSWIGGLKLAKTFGEKRAYSLFSVLLCIGLSFGSFGKTVKAYEMGQKRKVGLHQSIQDYQELIAKNPGEAWLPSLAWPFSPPSALYKMVLFSEDHPAMYHQDKGLIPGGWIVRHPFYYERLCRRLFDTENCRPNIKDILSHSGLRFLGRNREVRGQKNYFLDYYRKHLGCEFLPEVVSRTKTLALAKINLKCN